MVAAVHTTDWSSPANRLRAAASRGKRTGLPRAAWIDSLAALKKAITLCFRCKPKFNHGAYHYEKHRALPSHDYVIGECDGCAARAAQCQLYLPQENR